MSRVRGSLSLRSRGTVDAAVRVLTLAAVIASSFVVSLVQAEPADAAVSVTTTKLTWDVVGLDSNRPIKSAPQTFPVGAQLCNSSGSDTITNVTSTFTLGAGSTDIAASGATALTHSTSLAAGQCVEAYYHVALTRNANTFADERAYTIQFFDNGTSLGTSGARSGTLYVEKLISQNRNEVTTITTDAPCAANTPSTANKALQTCSFGAGKTYTITLYSKTAPQGYEQASAFLQLPTDLLTVTGVRSYYSRPTSPSTLPINGFSGVYADACGWKPYPATTAPGACVNDATYPGMSGLKAGGNPMRTVYTVTAASSVGESFVTETGSVSAGGLRGIIYDLSGSSFHYNGDAGTSKAISIKVIPSTDIAVSKTRVGSSANEGAFVKSTTYSSTTDHPSFLINLTNSTNLTAGTTTLTDTLPSGFTLASTETYTWTGTNSGRWSCSSAGTNPVTVTCTATWTSTNGQNFPAGATHTLRIGVNTPATSGSYTNAATIAASGYVDTNSANDTSSDTVSVVDSATLYDLQVSKTAASTTFTAGSTGSYTVTVKNNGPASAPASGLAKITVTDTLPANVTATSVTSISSGWSCPTSTGSSVVCETSTAMAKNASASFTINVSIGAGVTDPWVTNAASVSCACATVSVYDGNTANDSTSLRTAVGSADLSVRKTHTGAFAINTGGTGTGTFTMYVTNNGPSASTGVRLVDTLPAGLTFVSSGSGGTDWSCSASGQTVTCTRTGSLASGSTDTVTIPVTVSASATAGTVTNTVTVDTAASGSTNGVPNGTYDPVSANNSDSDVVSLALTGELAAGKTASASVTQPAGIAYTITLTNNSSSVAATNAHFTDILPSGVGLPTSASFAATGFTFTTAPTFADNCGTSGNEFACSIGTIPASGVVTVTFTSGATSTSTPTPAVNTVTVGMDQADSNPANDTATASTTVSGGSVQADLAISKVLQSPSDLRQGQPATYRLTVTNNGPSTTGFSLTDTLPSGLTYSSATGTGWSCSATGQNVSCSNSGTLANAATSTLDITVNVSGTATGTLANSATVSTTGGVVDPTSSNNTASVSKTVVATADLSVAKSLVTAALRQGQSAQYQVVVSNAGPSAATGITLTDTFPSELTFENITGSDAGWSCASWPTCTYSGSLAASASTTLKINTTVASTASGDKTNTATVTLNEYDPTTPNTSSVVKTVNATADLAVTKGLGAGQALRQGQLAIYDIVIQNNGPSTASGITASDTLPTGLSFVSGSGTDWACTSATNCTYAGTLANGASTTLSMTVSVAGNATVGDVTNTVTVSHAQYDPTTPNTATSTDPIAATANISVTKALAEGEVLRQGQEAVYEIVVSNAGPSTATGITLDDTLPAGLTFVGAEGTDWSCADATDCSYAASVASGASTTLLVTVAVAADATGDKTNSVTVAATEHDPQPSNNTDTSTDPVDPTADLAITKTSSTLVAGEEATFTLAVLNNGPSAAANVVVSDTLPEGLTFVSAAGTGWTCESFDPETRLVECSRAALATATPTSVTITVGVPAGAFGTISNTGTVTSDTFDPDPSDNSSTVEPTVTRRADLQLDKAGPATVSAGDGFDYTITVTNAGPSTAVNPVVTDTLPAGLTLDPSGWSEAEQGAFTADGTVPAPAGWTCDLDAGTVTCELAGSMALTDVAITIPVVADDPFEAANPIVNTASVSSDTTDPDPEGDEDNDDTVETEVRNAEVSITKTASTATAVPGGASFTYTITVSNAAEASRAHDLVVSDTLDGRLTLVGATSDDGFTCEVVLDVDDIPTNEIECTLASLAAGASAVITVEVTAKADATGTVSNTATVDVPNDPDPTPVPTPPVVTLDPSADLRITKTAAASTVAGGTFDYSLQVASDGPSDATGVIVTDVLPAGVSIDTTGFSEGEATGFAADGTLPAPAGWSCALATGTITCELTGSFADGDTATITIPVAADDPFLAADPIVNTATVTSDVDDPDEGTEDDDNTDSAQTSVGGADVSIDKVASTPTAVPGGGAFTYTITVSNAAGASAATNLVVSDTLDNRLVLVGATSDDGFICSVVLDEDDSPTNEIECTLATLGAGSSADITVEVRAKAFATGTVSNTATVDVPNDPDPTPVPVPPVVTLVPSADLSITKTGDATTVAGGIVDYSLEITSAGPSDATDVVVTDTLPAGVTLDTSGYDVDQATAFEADGTMVAPLGWECVLVAGVITCDHLGVLTDGETETLTFSVVVDDPFLAADPLENTASVTSAVDDPDEGTGDDDNTDTWATAVGGADVSIDKIASTATAVPGGDSFTYTITVANAEGSSAAVDLTVTDEVDPRLEILDVASEAFGCAVLLDEDELPTNTIECTLATLAAGTSADIVVTVAARAFATGTVHNTALVDVPNDPDPIPVPTPPAVTLEPSADLAIAKTGPAFVIAGAAFDYTLEITSAGPSDATDVVVTDTLPAGLTLDTSGFGTEQLADFEAAGTLPAPLGWDCVLAAGVITCDFGGILAEGDTETLTIPVVVDDPFAAADPMVNTATVTSAVDDPDEGENPTDNTSTWETSVNDAGVSIVKTASVTEAVPGGDSFTYTVTVANGPDASPAHDVVVTDEVDPRLEIVGATSDDGFVCERLLDEDDAPTNTVECLLDTLAPGATAEIVIEVAAEAFATGTVPNDATVVTPDDPDPEPEPTPPDVVLTPVADLSITKTAPAEIVAGAAFDYTLEVSSAGPSDATDVVVTDALPAGLSIDTDGMSVEEAAAFLDAGTLPAPLGWACALDAGTITCTLAGVLTDGETETLTIPVVADDPFDAADPIVNTASVSSDADDPDQGTENDDNSDSAETDVLDADVSIEKSASTADAVPGGDSFTYTITVSNAGGASRAHDLVVSDTLDERLALVGATSGDGFSCAVVLDEDDLPTNTLECSLDSLPAGQSASITVEVTVDPSAIGSVENTAAVDVPNDPDPLPVPVPPVVDLTPVADLSITKSAVTEIVAGGTFEYTLEVASAGPSDATDVTVSDVLPAGVSIDTSDFDADQVAAYESDGTIPAATTWSCAEVEGTVTCTFGSLAEGDVETLAIPVVADDPFDAADPIVNTASVSSDADDPDEGTEDDDNSDTAETDVIDAAVSITKTASVAEAVPGGDSFTYTITVSNAEGASRAHDLVLTDELDPRLVYVDATSADGITCAVVLDEDELPTNTIECTLDSLAAGSSASVDVEVEADPSATGTVANTATVDVPNDPDPTPVPTPPDVVLTPEADLSISKTADATTVAGDQLEYSITITSVGPSDATGVVVTDTLPSGVSLDTSLFTSEQSAAFDADGTLPAPAGWDCAYAAGTLTCSLSGAFADGDSATLTFLTEVDDPFEAGNPIVNTASVTSDVEDPDEGTENDDNTDDAETLVGAADVSIFKTASTTEAVPGGDSFTYSITVANAAGGSGAHGLVVTDVVDPRLDIIEATSEDFACGVLLDADEAPTNTVECTLDTLAAGGEALITIEVVAEQFATGTVPNTALVEVSNDPDPQPVPTPPDVDLTPQADLGITKSAVTEVAAGGSITYTLEVGNAGPSDATDVVVTDTLPAGVAVDTTGFDEDELAAFAAGGTVPVDRLGWTCTYDGDTSTITCAGAGIVADGETETLTFDVVVDDPFDAASPIVNEASVDSDQAGLVDPDDTNDRDDASTSVVPADLSITKAAVDGDDEVVTTAVPGVSSWIYTIVVANADGASPAHDVVVSDVVDERLDVIGFSEACDWLEIDGEPTRTLECTADTIAGGASVTFTIVVEPQADATGVVENEASVEWGPDGGPEPTPEPVVVTLEPEADLSIVKTLGVDDVEQGDSSTYTLHVENAGPSTAVNVVVTDTLPGGLTLDGDVTTPTGWLCAVESSTVTCTVESWDVDTTGVDIVIPVLLDADYDGGSIVNRGVIGSDTDDPDEGGEDSDNEDEVETPFVPPTTTTTSTTAPPAADLSASVLSAPASINRGDTLSYSLRLRNLGPNTSAGTVTVTHTVPAGTFDGSASALAAIDGPWSCSFNTANRLLTCTQSNLASASTFDLPITVSSTTAASGSTISLSATIAKGTTNDPVAANNTGTASVTVANRAPVGTDGRYEVLVSTSRTITIVATDLDEDTLTFQRTTSPSAGTLSSLSSPVCTNGTSWRCTTTITYTAGPVAATGLTFDVLVSDGKGGTDTLTITIDVVQTNRKPTITIEITPEHPLTNDTVTARIITSQDLDGDELVYDYVWWVNGVVMRRTLGTTSLTDGYDLSIPERGDLANLVSVVVTPSDGKENGPSAEDTVQVGNSAPTATASMLSVRQDSWRSMFLEGSDPDSQTLQFRITRLPVHGSLHLGTDVTGTPIALGASDGFDDDPTSFTISDFASQVSFKPSSGYFGADSFAFQAGDTLLWSERAATVTLGVFKVSSTSSQSESASGPRITHTQTPSAPPSAEAPVKTSVTASAETDTTGVSSIRIVVTDTVVDQSITPDDGIALVDFQQEITVTDQDGDPIDISDDYNVADPYQITFTISAALVPAWVEPADVVVYRDGEAVPACPEVVETGDLPCISAAGWNGDGDLVITVLSDHASDWNFAVPAAAPDTSIISAPAGVTNANSPNNINGGAVTFTYTATRSGSTFECQLRRANGGTVFDYAPCNSGTGSTRTVTYDVSSLPDDLYTLRVRATADGLTDATPARRDVVIDRTAPDVTITSGPTGTIGVRTATFTYESSEPGSTFRCQLNLGNWSSCNSLTKTYTSLANGTYIFTAEATDSANNTDTDVRQFVVSVSSGSSCRTSCGGDPQPSGPAGMWRVGGKDRIGTAAMLSRLAFPQGADVVYVATAWDYADALSAGPSATREPAPILLTPIDDLVQETIDELVRLAPRRIVVVGGWAAVSDRVFELLKPYAGQDVVRVAGVDRFGTAAALAREKFPNGAPTVYVATGRSYPDALAGGLAAASQTAPVLLTERDAIPAVTVDELARVKPPRIVVVGGEGAVSAAVFERLRGMTSEIIRVAGTDRFDTTAQVDREVIESTDTVFVVTGLDFADALTGVPIAAMSVSAVLMVDEGPLHPSVVAELQRLRPLHIIVLGGTGAVSSDVERQLADYLDAGTGERVRGLQLSAAMVKRAVEG